MVRKQSFVDETIKTPLYMQVYSALYQWIRQGRYQPGEKLDSEAVLCANFGVSRISVRKALDMLANEGWVRSRQGIGTFVSEKQPILAAAASMDAQIARSAEFAKASKMRDLQIDEIDAPAQLAAELQVAVSDRVTSVSYVRMVKRKPLGFVQSYFPRALGLKFTKQDFEQNSSVTVLANKGVAMSGIDNLFGATVADAQLATKLDTHVGVPLVRIKMTVLDEFGHPLAFLISHWLADSYEHHVYMARNTKTGAPRDTSPLRPR